MRDKIIDPAGKPFEHGQSVCTSHDLTSACACYDSVSLVVGAVVHKQELKHGPPCLLLKLEAPAMRSLTIEAYCSTMNHPCMVLELLWFLGGAFQTQRTAPSAAGGGVMKHDNNEHGVDA